MGDTGFEPTHNFTGKATHRQKSDAESDVTAAGSQSDVILDDGGLSVNDGVILAGDDAGLAAIVEALPKLSARIRRAVLALIDSEAAVSDAAVGN